MWQASGTEGPNPGEIESTIVELTRDVLTGCVASAESSDPWVFTAYLAAAENKFWFTSQETTKHVAQLRTSGRAALALWRQPQAWGDGLIGLQLSGAASEIVDESAAEAGLTALHNKFTGTVTTLPDASSVIGPARRTCLFEISCEEGSLRNEPLWGKGKFAISWTSS